MMVMRLLSAPPSCDRLIARCRRLPTLAQAQSLKPDCFSAMTSQVGIMFHAGAKSSRVRLARYLPIMGSQVGLR